MITELTGLVLDRLDATVGAGATAPLEPIAVEPMPDDWEHYRLAHPLGAALVGFGGARYADPESADGAVVQRRLVELDVALLTRSLQPPSGAAAYVEAVRLALTGRRTGGSGPLYPKRERLAGYASGVWTYVLTYEVAVTAIEPSAEELLPLLERVTTVDGYGGTETTESE